MTYLWSDKSEEVVGVLFPFDEGKCGEIIFVIIYQIYFYLINYTKCIYWFNSTKELSYFLYRLLSDVVQKIYFLQMCSDSSCFTTLQHWIVGNWIRLLFWRSTSQLTLFAFLLKSQPFHMQRYFCVCRWEIVYKLDTRKYNYI